MKTKLIILGLLLTMATLCWFLWTQNHTLKDTRQRLQENQNILINYKDSVDTFRVNDSTQGVHIHELVITNKELKKTVVEDIDIIADMSIDIKNLRQLNKTLTESSYHIITEVTDTILTTDSIPVYAKNITYNSEWADVKGTIIGETVDLHITSRESLLYIEHVTQKKFLFFNIGEKRIKQELISLNPNTKITGTEFKRIVTN